MILLGVIFSLFTAFFVFTNATVPIAPYETGRGAWAPVLTGVAVGFLEGFSIGVLIIAAIGIPWLNFRRRSSAGTQTSTQDQGGEHD